MPSPDIITVAQLMRLVGTPDVDDGVRAGAKRVEADLWDETALCFGLDEYPKRIAAALVSVSQPTTP